MGSEGEFESAARTCPLWQKVQTVHVCVLLDGTWPYGDLAWGMGSDIGLSQKIAYYSILLCSKNLPIIP